VRNESTKGSDIIGFRFVNEDRIDPNDELFVLESKAAMSGNTATDRLQVAVDDSHKDLLREAAALNAIKQRFYERGETVPAKRVERFQSIADRPFVRRSGAAAVINTSLYHEEVI
jgi:hypothetical protein